MRNEAITPGAENENSLEVKRARWREIETEVGTLRDKKGKGIDREIKNALVALRANSFGTTGSCGGHADHGAPWPWIDVESRIAEQLLSDARYQVLKEKARATRAGNGEATSEEIAEYQRLIDEQVRENEATYARLLKLLENFYETQTSGETGMRLVIRKGPWNQSRLQPKEVADLPFDQAQRSWSEEEKTQRLSEARDEFERLAQFLKQQFFVE